MVAPCSEAGHSTSTKSRAWWISYSFSVNCSCPWPPFHPSDFGEVSFLSMPARTIVGPSGKARQHHLKNRPHVPAIPQESRGNIKKSSSHGLLAWAVQRVAPKEFLSPYTGSFLTRKWLLITFLHGSTNHLLESTGPRSPSLAKLTYASSQEAHRDAFRNMCLASKTSPLRALTCHCTGWGKIQPM